MRKMRTRIGTEFGGSPKTAFDLHGSQPLRPSRAVGKEKIRSAECVCLQTTRIDMPTGTLEVLLVSARGLENADLLCKMDPYVIIRCRSQEQKSTVASSQGANPEWNEKFVFNVSEGVSDLNLKIMDKDSFSADDFVGEANIPLEGLFEEGSLPPTPYNVVLPDKTYCGEIKVGLTFIPKREAAPDAFGEEEEIGGWKESSY